MFAVLVLLYLATGEGNFVSKVEEGMSPAEVGTLLKEFSQELQEVKNMLNTLKEQENGNMPTFTRVCNESSYLAYGYCMPKFPSDYINHTSCDEGFKLLNGVCYSWPDPQCQTQPYLTAKEICSCLGGRLCTVPELDRLGGTGCYADAARSWAILSTKYLTGSSQYNANGVCFRSNEAYRNQFPNNPGKVINTIGACYEVSSNL
jgi:hypothetical protein